MSKAGKIFSRAAALAAVVFLSSCVTNDYSLGSDLIPSDREIQVSSASFDVNPSQRYPDSLQTSINGSAMVGSIYTSEFGMLNVGTALSITPASDSIVWGKDPVFKRMKLAVPIKGCQVMDDSQKTIPQNIHVHKMRVMPDSTKIYYNSISETDYEPSCCTVGTSVYCAGDTLHVYFNEEFAKPLFDLDTSILNDATAFMRNFYGIYLDTDSAPAIPGSGRLNTFDLQNAMISFTFNSVGDLGVRRDTTVFFYVGDRYSTMRIVKDRLQAESATTGGEMIYDGMTGIKPVIDAAGLKSELDGWLSSAGIANDRIILTKALFEFPFEYEGSGSQFKNWPGNIYLCRRLRDSLGMIYYSPISEIYGESNQTGTINRSLKTFASDAPEYIRSLISADASEIDDTYDLWLMPVVSYTYTSTSSSGYNNYYSMYYMMYYGYDPYTTTSSQTFYYADNVNYVNCHINGSGAARHPVLRISYTALK